MPLAPGMSYPQEMRDRVAALLRGGSPNKTIISETGVSQAFIKDVAHSVGVFRGARGVLLTAEQAAEAAAARRKITAKTTPEQDAAILAKALENYSRFGDPKAEAIAAEMNVGIAGTAVRDRLKIAGWAAPEGKLHLAPPSNGVSPAGLTAKEFREAVVEAATTPIGKVPVDSDSNATSQKILFLKRLVTEGPFGNERELTVASSRWPEIRWGGHELKSHLHEMRKQGWVEFKASPHGAGGQTMRRIESTVKGRNYVRTLRIEAGELTVTPEQKPVLAQNERRDPRYTKPVSPPARQPVASAPETPSAPAPAAPERPVSPEPVAASGTPRWPLLDVLRARAAAKSAASERRDALLAAAALLADIEKEESDRLVTLAAKAEGDPFSPLETEFLSFAEACK